MEFVRGIHNLKPWHRGCILSIGNFDGFHRGHQALVLELQTEARSCHLPAMIMIFEPQPEEYLIGHQYRLTNLRDKIKYFYKANIDIVLCITFNKNVSVLTASTFVNRFLMDKLSIKCIYIGDDFKFGANRLGDFFLLEKIGKYLGFKVNKVNTCFEGNKRISSSAIREALIQDRLPDAEILLGHTYCISGRIIHGNAIGKMIGFPTANISLKGQQVPLSGVYAVEVHGIGSYLLLGIANIGKRPTVNGYYQILEVHLFDITLDLYGCYIEVIIRSKIRNEKKFLSLKELKYQIKNDVIDAKNYFNSLLL